MASFFRTILITLFCCGLLVGGWWWLLIDQQARALRELEAMNQQLQQQLAQRQAVIQRLSRSRRIAHLQILDQSAQSDGSIQSTTVRLIELDDQGSELARQDFTIPGNVLFVDGWTIKFDPERVGEGDPLRGQTLVLLRRIYSDRLPPKDGLAIDTPGAIPPGYATSEVSRFEKQLWEYFWTLASEPDAAREMGVRVAQGEAVYKPVRAGQTFELVVDAVGGMSLTPVVVAEASSR